MANKPIIATLLALVLVAGSFEVEARYHSPIRKAIRERQKRTAVLAAAAAVVAAGAVTAGQKQEQSKDKGGSK